VVGYGLYAQKDIPDRIARFDQLLYSLFRNLLAPDFSEGESELLDLLPEQVRAVIRVEVFQIRILF
jgi:hypothetical protein